MNLRLVLFELAATQGAGTALSRRLQQLADLGQEPAPLRAWLPRGLAVLAAALAGLGLVMWIAAQWATLGRLGQFAFLQAAVALPALAAWWFAAVRVPLALLSLLAIGALFAFFGQTYQTGADAWQLFAWWALAGLPLCLAVRSDVTWTPWVVVALVAVSLWTVNHVGGRAWRQTGVDTTAVHAAGWAMSLLIVLLVSPPWRALTRAGLWSLRTALVLAVAGITTTAVTGLFATTVTPIFGLGVLVLAGAAAVLSRRSTFDVFGLSAAMLGFDTLVVCGLARWALEDRGPDPVGVFLLIGLAAAGLLALSVRWVLHAHRAHGEAVA